MSNVETVTGGTGSDAVTLGSQATGAIVDLAGGIDTLTLANQVNTQTVSNVETLTGGTTNDLVTLGAAMTGGVVNLGAGAESLTLANALNTLTVSNVETLAGGDHQRRRDAGQRLCRRVTTSAPATTGCRWAPSPTPSR